MSERPTIYFAHAPCSYGTEAESTALKYLAQLHPDHTIINPAKLSGSERTRISLVRASDMVVFISLGDGKIASNVAEEVRQALKTKKVEVHEMHVSDHGIPIPMVSNVTRIDDERVLSKEDSDARVMPQVQPRWRGPR